MIFRQPLAVLVLGVTLGSAPLLVHAQNPDPGTYPTTRKQESKDLKAQEKAEKAQAKADKAERKEINSKKAKKAAKAQDKADRDAAQASQPQ